ncbi:MAG TPA: hypothetical protein VLA34_12565, partial [Candidatus Krumholzibacterium sp.]|nr:hypothetical protein [Candidatus Krumholzibacterium sp.]
MQYWKSTILSLVLVVFLSLSTIPAVPARAQAPGEKKTEEAAVKKTKDSREIQVGEWLVLGPVKTPFPAFHDTEKADDDATFLLSFRDMDISSFTPVAGGRVDVFGGDMAWFRSPADSTGTLIDHSEAHPSTVYLATWIELPRWMEIEVEASSTNPFELYVDGRSVAKCTSGTGTGQLGEIKTGSASLKQGKYLVVAKGVHVPADTASEWRFNAYVKAKEKFREDPVVTLD